MNESDSSAWSSQGNGFEVSPDSLAPLGQGGRRGKLARLNVPPEVLRTLPADFVKRHRVLPFETCRGTLHVAIAEPGNQRLIDDIRLLSGLEVREFGAPASEILEKIAECYQVTVEQMVENLNPQKGKSAEGKNLHDIEVMANEPTVINLVNVIISTAVRERASASISSSPLRAGPMRRSPR